MDVIRMIRPDLPSPAEVGFAKGRETGFYLLRSCSLAVMPGRRDKGGEGG
jgi:hypothetical protein